MQETKSKLTELPAAFGGGRAETNKFSSGGAGRKRGVGKIPRRSRRRRPYGVKIPAPPSPPPEKFLAELFWHFSLGQRNFAIPFIVPYFNSIN